MGFSSPFIGYLHPVTGSPHHLTEMKDILKRWNEYGTELFDTATEETSTTPNINVEEKEPEPLLSEVEEATKQLKSGKSPGMDGIPAELLKNTGPSGIKAMHYLCVKIWQTCQWPDEWKQQEFVMLYKKGSSKECGNYRTIALISHASKVLLIIILNRLKRKVEEELSDCQAGYRRNRGTIDMLFTLQLLIEEVRNSKEEAFIIFIDYTKAFDSVKHSNLFQIMINMGFPEHLVSLIANLYTNQKATIRWNGEHCEFFNIRKGVRQGCILSPHLFNIYTEQVMRNADIDGMGVSIGGRNISNLRYADDTALAGGNVTSSRRILHRVDSSGKAEGLGLNAPKTKVMHVKGEESLPDGHTDIRVGSEVLEKVTDFKYLGSVKSADGTCLKDIRTRIGMAKQKMLQLLNLWKDSSIPTELKIRLLKCLIWPVIMYGCEAWTLRKSEESRLNAVEMWLYRCLLDVKWQQKRTNDSILEELGVERRLLLEVNLRKMRYIGHANRNQRTDLMTSVLQGRVQSARRRGRPATTLVSNVRNFSGLSLGEVIHESRDRENWRTVVATRRAATFIHGDADR